MKQMTNGMIAGRGFFPGKGGRRGFPLIGDEFGYFHDKPYHDFGYPNFPPPPDGFFPGGPMGFMGPPGRAKLFCTIGNYSITKSSFQAQTWTNPCQCTAGLQWAALPWAVRAAVDRCHRSQPPAAAEPEEGLRVPPTGRSEAAAETANADLAEAEVTLGHREAAVLRLVGTPSLRPSLVRKRGTFKPMEAMVRQTV